MKNEIKEILEALRDSIDDTGTNKVNFINWVDKIEDYITNLKEERNSMACLVNDIQEELDNLQQIEKDHQKLNGELREENERLIISLSAQEELTMNEYYKKNNYKSRIDKAIEYINAGKTFTTINVGQVVNKIQNDLLKILQGEDNE